jgi:hypothetical protein
MAPILEKEWSELRGITYGSLNTASAGEQKNLGAWSVLQALFSRSPQLGT